MPKTKAEILSSLIDASFLLISSLDVKEILPKAMETIKELLECEAASIMLVDETKKQLSFEVALGEKGGQIKNLSIPLGEGVAGKVAKDGIPLIVNDLTEKSNFSSKIDEKSGFKTKSILCVPLKIKDTIIGVAQALNPLTKSGFDEEDLYLLALFSNQVALVVESSRLHNQIVERKLIESELDFARRVQESFLPQEFIKKENFSFYGLSCAAKKVGGDFFDVFNLDEERIGFTIGDVSGKGIPAAIFMAKVLANLKFLAQKYKDNNDPAAILNELNSLLLDRRLEQMFVTLTYGIFFTSTNKIILASAGHPYPFFYEGKDKKWKLLQLPNGLPAGIFNKGDYKNKEFQLLSKDVILLITDGVTEVTKESDEAFIISNLGKISLASLPKEIVIQEFVKNFSGFIKSFNPNDDFTLLALSVK